MRTECDTETLSLVAQAVADFARPDARRARLTRDSCKGSDPLVWRAMAEQGWLSALLPEQFGGVDLGLRAAVIIAERLGYACHSEPFVGVAVLAARCLLACDESRLRNEWLRQLGNGSRQIALAWQSMRGDFDLHASGVDAQVAGDGFLLEGRSRFVVNAAADAFVVSALCNGELLLCAVARDAQGLTVTPEAAADGSALGLLALVRVFVPFDAVLAKGEVAGKALADAVDAAVLCTAAELLGLIDRSLDVTRTYLCTREQFNQPIGAFQVLQHRMVDMWIQKELTRAALKSALDVHDDPSSPAAAREAAASSAKARASQAALYVAGQAVQLHGAIGFTDEYELGVYVNRSLALSAALGNAAFHRRRYGERIQVQER